MEFNITDPINNLLNIQIVKYQVCDCTNECLSEENEFNKHDLNDISKFNIPNLEIIINNKQRRNLNLSKITQISLISNYLRSITFLFVHYYGMDQLEVFKKSIFDVYYTQIIKIYLEHFLIEKKHHVETFLLNNKDSIPVEKEYIFKIIDLIYIYKHLGSYHEMEEEWEYMFYEEYVNLMNNCFSLIRPNILKVFDIDLFSSGHLIGKNIKNLYDLKEEEESMEKIFTVRK